MASEGEEKLTDAEKPADPTERLRSEVANVVSTANLETLKRMRDAAGGPKLDPTDEHRMEKREEAASKFRTALSNMRDRIVSPKGGK